MSGVATFDSHGRAPCLLGRTPLRGSRLLFSFTRTSRTVTEMTVSCFACSSRWIRPCSLWERVDPNGNRSRPGMSLEPTPGIAPPRVQRPCVQRPNATPRALSGSFCSAGSGLFLVAPDPRFRGRQSLCPPSRNGRRSGWFRSPFGSDRRDPNTLAPNRLKARTTPLRPSRISACF